MDYFTFKHWLGARTGLNIRMEKLGPRCFYYFAEDVKALYLDYTPHQKLTPHATLADELEKMFVFIIFISDIL